jgi:hypothetical protein
MVLLMINEAAMSQELIVEDPKDVDFAMIGDRICPVPWWVIALCRSVCIAAISEDLQRPAKPEAPIAPAPGL